MGDKRRQRTEDLHNAARRYVLAKQAIAQHNLDKLVRSGVIMTEPSKATTDKAILDGSMSAEAFATRIKEGGPSRKALPPRWPAGAVIIEYPDK